MQRSGKWTGCHHPHSKKITVFLELPRGKLVHTHPVTTTNNTGHNKTVFPFSPAYALTISKAQGQTLSSILVWFDVNTLPPACAYVTLSRVKCLHNRHLLTPENATFPTSLTLYAFIQTNSSPFGSQ